MGPDAPSLLFSAPSFPCFLLCSQDGLKRRFWTSGFLRFLEVLGLPFLCLLPNLTSAFKASSQAALSRKPAMTSSILYHNSCSFPAQRGEATQPGSHSKGTAKSQTS